MKNVDAFALMQAIAMAQEEKMKKEREKAKYEFIVELEEKK